MEDVTTSSQDYLETILILSRGGGQVRSIDIANNMQVSRASVNKALGVLKEKGMIRHEKYGTVSLTEEGIKVADSVRLRHNALKKLLVDTLGVSQDIAEQDACGMEHVISNETYTKLKEYIKKQKE